MQMAPVLWLFLALSWGGGRLFELQEAIEELQSENAQLQGKIQNLTEALSELRLFVWNRSQAGGDADVLNWCLTTTMDWMRANKMKLNPGKTAMLLVGGSLDRMEGIQSFLDEVALP
ncbi:Chaperone protein DnaK [Varanus komodoensis]|nr:Chaperone protein DnaK [Varanus komodoensis]